MFQLVYYEDREPAKEEKDYLCKVAGQTVAEGLKFVYDPKLGDDHLEMLIESHFPFDFFQGFAGFVGMTEDMEAGKEWIKRKVDRMIWKMEDPNKAYTFDVFEEVLFAIAIGYARDDIEFTKKVEIKADYPFVDKEKENEVAGKLMEEFGYKTRGARKMARTMIRFHEMLLKEEEDENLFFWDRDYEFFFAKGFVEGIQMLKSFAGDQAGYGYDYTCKIFTDVGMRAPLRLMGTREANRIANEASRQRMEEVMNNLWS